MFVTPETNVGSYWLPAEAMTLVFCCCCCRCLCACFLFPPPPGRTKKLTTLYLLLLFQYDCGANDPYMFFFVSTSFNSTVPSYLSGCKRKKKKKETVATTSENWNQKMFCYSRLCFPRSAVAFFNMKQFQIKYKALMTAENAYVTLSSCLMPRDRLMRYSTSGRGAGRVLVLDSQQKVKGVYVPVCCLPHPATVGGNSSLGITVEDYLKVIMPVANLSPSPDAADTKATTEVGMPTVLAVVAQPQGIAFGTFYADGRPALPLVNTALGAQTPLLAETDETAGQVVAATQVASSFRTFTSLLPVMKELQSLLDKNAADVACCSTFYWIMRAGVESISVKALQMCEDRLKRNGDFRTSDTAAGSSVAAEPAEHAISFADRRWMMLHDTFFDASKIRLLYTFDPATHHRIVDAAGLQAVLQSGTLLLDYVPRSVRNASASTTSAVEDPKKA